MNIELSSSDIDILLISVGLWVVVELIGVACGHHDKSYGQANDFDDDLS